MLTKQELPEMVSPTDAARELKRRLNIGLPKARLVLKKSGIKPIVIDPDSRKGIRYSTRALNEYLERLEAA